MLIALIDCCYQKVPEVGNFALSLTLWVGDF